MKFLRFTILKESRTSSTASEEEKQISQEEILLINEKHLVSIKPIRVVHQEHLFDGYWLRLTNGKKYRALDLPLEIKQLLDNPEASAGKKVRELEDGQELFIQ